MSSTINRSLRKDHANRRQPDLIKKCRTHKPNKNKQPRRRSFASKPTPRPHQTKTQPPDSANPWRHSRHIRSYIYGRQVKDDSRTSWWFWSTLCRPQRSLEGTQSVASQQGSSDIQSRAFQCHFEVIPSLPNWRRPASLVLRLCKLRLGLEIV